MLEKYRLRGRPVFTYGPSEAIVTERDILLVQPRERRARSRATVVCLAVAMPVFCQRANHPGSSGNGISLK